MKLEITTDIKIQSTSEKIWKILMDFKQYPQWNPFVKSIEGNTSIGSKLNAQLQDMKFAPVVVECKKEKEFRWLGHLFFKGLFDGEHSFRLVDNQDGTTTFVHSEKFKGILVRLMKKKLTTDIVEGFKEMNLALKNRVEGQSKN